MLRRVVEVKTRFSLVPPGVFESQHHLSLSCGHSLQVVTCQQKFVATGDSIICPHCGEEGKRGEEEKSEADGPRSV